jgi:hypothetical protein
MRHWLVRSGPSAGLLGVAVIAIAAFAAALTYSGHDGEPYSPLNHTVSELGERDVSSLTWIALLAWDVRQRR